MLAGIAPVPDHWSRRPDSAAPAAAAARAPQPVPRRGRAGGAVRAGAGRAGDHHAVRRPDGQRGHGGRLAEGGRRRGRARANWSPRSRPTRPWSRSRRRSAGRSRPSSQPVGAVVPMGGRIGVLRTGREQLACGAAGPRRLRRVHGRPLPATDASPARAGPRRTGRSTRRSPTCCARCDRRRLDLRSASELPKEAEIAERFGVSLITVRQALRDLAADGLIRSARPSRRWSPRAPRRST